MTGIDSGLESRLVSAYRVEYEDFGRMNFNTGDEWETVLENYKRARRILHECRDRMAVMLADLSDGLVVDVVELDTIGKRLWFSKCYLQRFAAVIQ